MINKSLPKKICCIGTHGVGKSTFAYQLADQYKRQGKNVYVIQEVVRECPYPINDSMRPETAIWTVCEQIRQELSAQNHGYDVIVCDRSAYDPIIYAKNKFKDGFEFILNELHQMALEWLNTYESFYWIRPDMDLKEDGIRSMDNAFQLEIDELFLSIHDRIKDRTQTVWTSEIINRTELLKAQN